MTMISRGLRNRAAAEVLGLEFVCLSVHFKGHTVVNLHIGRIHLFQINEALAAIHRNELIFDLLGQAGALAEPRNRFFVGSCPPER